MTDEKVKEKIPKNDFFSVVGRLGSLRRAACHVTGYRQACGVAFLPIWPPPPSPKALKFDLAFIAFAASSFKIPCIRRILTHFPFPSTGFSKWCIGISGWGTWPAIANSPLTCPPQRDAMVELEIFCVGPKEGVMSRKKQTGEEITRNL
jgi:hypothetical protein